ncbi:peptidylprolyl isomerase [Cucumibacter marinus]|uniref:peptidylprolyl isomerase n=1 Tax=Cucumibacter marinus TaxID=1121252 RepID=UPI0003FA2CE8|nr:peptidylprolyl isomerase [Cucumibacter marinus]
MRLHTLVTAALFALMTPVTAAFVAVPLANAATVKVVVNGQPISDAEINQRAGLMRLERRGSSNAQRRSMAQDELINEALQLQEAEKLGIKITSSKVDEIYERVATNMGLSSGRLSDVLRSNGVNEMTLRSRLKAQVAWQQVVQQVVQQRVQLSNLELDKAAQEQIQGQTYDFLLKEILFVIPKGSGISASSRTADANRYRQSFNGCDSAVELSLKFRDAAVRDLGRRHSTQLPDALASELNSLNVGGISKPRTVNNGVQLLAICSKAQAEDTSFIKNKLRQEQGTEKLKEEAEAYLANLKKNASIEIR